MLNIENFLEKYIKKSDKFILACSTGPDSMYLLYKILETKYKDNLIVCYFNHKLRKKADKEEKYIEKLGKKLGFIVETGSKDIKKLKKESKSKSLEEIAREKRYEFLSLIKLKHNAKYILTAHHLDDKIETFFFNLARGSKISGLINMTEFSGDILRPLLGITKNEILSYLEKNKFKYFVDKTNLDTKITRNYLRLKLIPKFEKINKNYKENIGNFMDYLGNLKDFVDDKVVDFLEDNNFIPAKAGIHKKEGLQLIDSCLCRNDESSFYSHKSKNLELDFQSRLIGQKEQNHTSPFIHRSTTENGLYKRGKNINSSYEKEDKEIGKGNNENPSNNLYKEGKITESGKVKILNSFSIKQFNKKNLFLQKEIIRYIFYISNNNSTIGLSEANIDEILKFINGKNNKTIKEIKNLKMKKDGDRIFY